MAIIPVLMKRTFDVASSPHDTHGLLSNVPRSASHVPEVQEVVRLDDLNWRWVMNPQGFGGVTLQAIYVCRYGFDRDALRVTWETVKEEGSFMDVSGHWQLEPLSNGTRANLLMDMRFDLPVPQMLVGMAQPMLSGELEKQMDVYVAALTRTLGAIG